MHEDLERSGAFLLDEAFDTGKELAVGESG